MSKSLTPDQAIIDAIMARFKTIAAGDNYYTTFGDNVFDSRTEPLDDSELPGITIHDADEPVEIDNAENFHTCKITVFIDVIVAKNPAASDIRKAKNDILKSIGTDITWSGLAVITKHITTASNLVNQQGDLVANRRIQIEITYRKPAWSK